MPAPQRQALEIVFGVAGGPRRIGLWSVWACSVCCRTAAEERPLLCVVDDAQWLDQASAVTLAFVARRLLGERVGIVFAARESGQELQDVSELEVSGVRNGDARALLGTAVRFMLDERVRDRIIAEMGGNPLALLELPRGLTASELAVGSGCGRAGLSGRIEESFIRRLSALSDDARRLLLLAAAEPIGDPVLLWGAAGVARDRPGAAEAAEARGLLTIGERVIISSSAVRSAVYTVSHDRGSAGGAFGFGGGDRSGGSIRIVGRGIWPRRRRARMRRSLRSLARSAGRARARGGVAAAAALLRRSVALTRDPGGRAERALAAAQAHLQAGAFDGRCSY